MAVYYSCCSAHCLSIKHVSGGLRYGKNSEAGLWMTEDWLTVYTMHFPIAAESKLSGRYVVENFAPKIKLE